MMAATAPPQLCSRCGVNPQRVRDLCGDCWRKQYLADHPQAKRAHDLRVEWKRRDRERKKERMRTDPEYAARQRERRRNKEARRRLRDPGYRERRNVRQRVSNLAMSDEKRERIRKARHDYYMRNRYRKLAYSRQWAAKNKERRREYSRRYKEKRKAIAVAGVSA